MAIKVLRHGKKAPNKYKVECDCGCIVICEAEDIIDNSQGTFVRCPDCQRLIRNFCEYEEEAEEIPVPLQNEWKINCDGYYPYCSVCKCEPPGREMTPFCPMCGAKLKK